jgi:hypothetical protein
MNILQKTKKKKKNILKSGDYLEPLLYYMLINTNYQRNYSLLN